MENTIKLNVPLTFQQIVDLVRQLPLAERKKLISVLQEDKYNDPEQVPLGT